MPNASNAKNEECHECQECHECHECQECHEWRVPWFVEPVGRQAGPEGTEQPRLAVPPPMCHGGQHEKCQLRCEAKDVVSTPTGARQTMTPGILHSWHCWHSSFLALLAFLAFIIRHSHLSPSRSYCSSGLSFSFISRTRWSIIIFSTPSSWIGFCWAGSAWRS